MMTVSCSPGPELSRLLECPLIRLCSPIPRNDRPQFSEKTPGMAPREKSPFRRSFRFRSQSREFQFWRLKQEGNPLLSLGYIPKLLERNRSSLLELCLDSMAERAVFPVKAAASQLASIPGQIDWNALWGFARLNQEWTEVPEPFRGKAAGLTVGVVTHSGLELEGDNARRLFSYLGCSVRKIFLDEVNPALDVNAVYVPHGPGFLSAEKILARQGMRDSRFRGLLIQGRSYLQRGQHLFSANPLNSRTGSSTKG